MARSIYYPPPKRRDLRLHQRLLLLFTKWQWARKAIGGRWLKPLRYPPGQDHWISYETWMEHWCSWPPNPQLDGKYEQEDWRAIKWK